MDARLILDGPLPGKENMARDEALLSAGTPALRFYTWAPPCVSIGYFQNPERDIDTDFLATQGIDLVRRPTGGRAVLHEHEITYSIVLPHRLLPAGVIPSYKKIAALFVSVLTGLGFACELRGPEGRPDRGGVCFAASSAYEIAVGGRKVLGSAQVVRGKTVLQHGSLLLKVDYGRHARCMKGPAAVTAEKLRERMCGLNDIKAVDPDQVMKGVSDLFSREFNLRLVP